MSFLRCCRLIPCAGEALDSVDEVALKVVGFSGAANERKTLMEFLERDYEFSSGEVRTEAEMWSASPEANLRGLHRASHVELVGVVKHPLITVGARVEQHHFVASRELFPSEFGVSGHRATEMNHRRCIPDDLFYRSLRIGIEVAKPEVALVRVVSQGVQTVGESVPCRFVAGNDKKNGNDPNS